MPSQRRYSLIPRRAGKLVRRAKTWRVLHALCLHTSKYGVAYPNQRTLSEIIDMGQPDVSKAIRELHDLGLLRYLLPKGRKHPNAYAKGNRYQILYEEDAPLPSEKEQEVGPGHRPGRFK